MRRAVLVAAEAVVDAAGSLNEDYRDASRVSRGNLAGSARRSSCITVGAEIKSKETKWPLLS